LGEIRLSGIATSLYNPFAATEEELLAAALDEAGILGPLTVIEGLPAAEHLRKYFAKRAKYVEVTKLGSLLVQRGILRDDQLQSALDFQRDRRGDIRLGEALVELGICSLDEIERHLDAQIQIREDLKNLEDCRRRIDSIKERLRQHF